MRYSALISVLCSLCVAMTVDPHIRAQDQGAAVDDSRSSCDKRHQNGWELQRFHHPWDTIPMHCLDFGSGRSSIDDESPEQIWEYLKQSTAILEWRSECPSTALLALI